MKIGGIQKLTLLDYPGHLAATIFLCGCNFRCPYCHNASLVFDSSPTTNISSDSLFDFLKKRQGILEGVCITGGEPLLSDKIFDLIKKIKELNYMVKLDTNGTFPEKLKKLVNDKMVDYVAVDIKNSKEKYLKTIGLSSFSLKNIEETVSFLLENHVPYEFRTTVVSEFHEMDDFIKIAKWITGTKKYFLQNFVDSGNLIKDGLHGFTKEDMQKAKEIIKPYIPSVEIRGI